MVGSDSATATGGGVGGSGVALGTIRASSRGTIGFGGTVASGRGLGRAGTGTGTGTGTAMTRGRTTGRGDCTATGGGLVTGTGVSTVICVSATTDSGAPPSRNARNTNAASTASASAWMRIEQRYATANLRRSPGVRRTRGVYRSSASMACSTSRWPIRALGRRAEFCFERRTVSALLSSRNNVLSRMTKRTKIVATILVRLVIRESTLFRLDRSALTVLRSKQNSARRQIGRASCRERV